MFHFGASKFESNRLAIVMRLDRFYGLVFRVPDYRSRGPRFNSRLHQIFRAVVGLEWGPFSLVRINEELLKLKSTAAACKTEIISRWDPLR
jgi:hypothetical protein